LKDTSIGKKENKRVKAAHPLLSTVVITFAIEPARRKGV